MNDPRYDKLAKLLAGYSCALKKGENVFIDVADIPDRMTVALIRAARSLGANPIVEVRQPRVVRELIKGTNEEHSKLTKDLWMLLCTYFSFLFLRHKSRKALLTRRGIG